MMSASARLFRAVDWAARTAAPMALDNVRVPEAASLLRSSQPLVSRGAAEHIEEVRCDARRLTARTFQERRIYDAGAESAEFRRAIAASEALRHLGWAIKAVRDPEATRKHPAITAAVRRVARYVCDAGVSDGGVRLVAAGLSVRRLLELSEAVAEIAGGLIGSREDDLEELIEMATLTQR